MCLRIRILQRQHRRNPASTLNEAPLLPGGGVNRAMVGVLVAVCVGCGDAQPTRPTPVISMSDRPPEQYSLSGSVQDRRSGQSRMLSLRSSRVSERVFL
jgi:hypothetical protein